MTKRKDNKGEGGYRRPPEHARFKKGQSGNPKGRPRKTKPKPQAEETMLEEFLRLGMEEREFTNPKTGEKRMMRPRTAALLKIWTEAGQNFKAAFEVFNLHRTEIVQGKAGEAMSAEDEKIFARFLERNANDNDNADEVNDEEASDWPDGATS